MTSTNVDNDFFEYFVFFFKNCKKIVCVCYLLYLFSWIPDIDYKFMLKIYMVKKNQNDKQNVFEYIY